jgi:hypothetical protein
MFDIRKGYGFDKVAAEAGVKMVIGPVPETDYVVVRKLPNDSYRAKLSNVMLAMKKQLDMLKAQDEAKYTERDADLYAEVLAETILVGWGEGVLESGKPMVYSVEAAKKLLLDYPDFKAEVVEFAASRSNFPLEPDVADIKKN